MHIEPIVVAHGENTVSLPLMQRTYSLGTDDCFVTRKDGESTQFTPAKFDPKEKIIALPYSSGTTGTSLRGY